MRIMATAACLVTPVALRAAPQVYTIEPMHTYPSFKTAHMGLSYWRGKFDHTSGKVWLDRTAKTGRVDIQIDVRSIDFGLPILNKVALGDDFFQAEQFPTAIYKSDSIRFEGDKPVAINGELTLRGITKPVKLQVLSFNCVQHPMFKREVCGADVRAQFDRREFGMTRDIVPADPNVRLMIQVEAVLGDTLPALPPPPLGGEGGAPPPP
jgi:polyisoprenoid-binding protein YceI